MYNGTTYSLIVQYSGFSTSGSDNYGKLHDLKHDVDYTLPNGNTTKITGRIIMQGTGSSRTSYIAKNDGTLTAINESVACAKNFYSNNYAINTVYITRNGNNIQYNVIDDDGNSVGVPVNYTLRGTPSGPINLIENALIIYKYSGTLYEVRFETSTGTPTETVSSGGRYGNFNTIFDSYGPTGVEYFYNVNKTEGYTPDITNVFTTNRTTMIVNYKSNYYYSV